MDKISVIVPCFNEEEVLPLFYKEVVHTLEKIQNIDYEILFINDGSQDHSEDILKLLAHKNKHCFYYSFSRNFSHHGCRSTTSTLFIRIYVSSIKI